MSFSAQVVESNLSVQLILTLERYQNTIVLGTTPFKTLKYCGLKTNVLEGSSFVFIEKKVADQPFENKDYL